jgi:hypothetical protein
VLFAFSAAAELVALGFLLGPELAALCTDYCGVALTALQAIMDPAAIGETITVGAYLQGIGGLTLLTGVVGVRLGVYLQDIGLKVKAGWALIMRTGELADQLQGLGKLGPTELPEDLAYLTDDWKKFGGLSREEFVRTYWDPTVRNADGTFGNWNWSKARPDADLPVSPTPYRPKAGEVWDGFAGPKGPQLSPFGTPFAERSLPPGSLTNSYVKYRWLKDWDEAAGGVQSGRIPGGFEQPGGGTQFKLDKSLEELERLGYIQRLPGSLDDWERDIAAVVTKYHLDDEVAGLLREAKADPATVDRLLGRGVSSQSVALTSADHGAAGLRVLDALTGNGVAAEADALTILQDAASIGLLADAEALARAGVIGRLVGRGIPPNDIGALLGEYGAGGLRALDGLIQGGVANTAALRTLRDAKTFDGIADVERLATSGRFENLNSLPDRVAECAADARVNLNARRFEDMQYGHQFVLRSAAERSAAGRVAMETSDLPSINNGSRPSGADLFDHRLRQAIQMKAVTAASPPRPENPDRVVTNILDGAAQLRGERGDRPEWPPQGYRRVIDVYVLNPLNNFYGIADRAELLAALKAKGLTAEGLAGVDELWISNLNGTFKFFPVNFL